MKEKEFTVDGHFIEKPIEQLDPKLIEQQQSDFKKAEIKVKTKLYAVGAGILGVIGYAAYQIPKLPEKVNYETLKIVGVLFVGLIIGAKMGNVKLLSGNVPTTTERIFRNIGGGAMLGSLLYFISRGIFKSNINNSLKISGALTFATLGYLFYNEEKNKQIKYIVK